MVSLDLFLFHEFGLTSLTNVHRIGNTIPALVNLLLFYYTYMRKGGHIYGI